MGIAKKSGKIAVASRSFSKNPILRRELEERYADVRFNDSGRSLAGPDLIDFLNGAEKAITALEKIDDSILSKLPGLKVISKYGVGLDMIDFEAMHSRGVLLGWSGGVNRRSVAELALAFMLVLVRGIAPAAQDLARGKWQQHPGNELTGKTVGIIGCGFVGQELIRLLEPFQCEILVNDIREYPFFEKHALTIQGVDELLSKSEIVSLHVPLDASTKGLLSAEKIMRMRKGAILINTARGKIVDEPALKLALQTGHLRGAGFDVFAQEPPEDLELLSHPAFYGTPHIGGSSFEAILAMGRAAIDNLEHGRPATVQY